MNVTRDSNAVLQSRRYGSSSHDALQLSELTSVENLEAVMHHTTLACGSPNIFNLFSCHLVASLERQNQGFGVVVSCPVEEVHTGYP